jgi:hypothetical protein
MLDLPTLNSSYILLNKDTADPKNQYMRWNFSISFPEASRNNRSLAKREIIEQIYQGKQFLGTSIFPLCLGDKEPKLIVSLDNPTLFAEKGVYLYNNPIPHVVEPFNIPIKGFRHKLWAYSIYFL